MDYKATNSIVHLLFLVESLLLKKAASVIRPGVRPKKIHLLVEKVRPHGITTAVNAVSVLGKDKEAFIELLKKLVSETALKVLPPETVNALIDRGDLELIYELLTALNRSDLYLRWGGGREFI